MAGAQQEQVGVEIDRHDLAPFVGGELADVAAGRENAGVQHQHVQAAVRKNRALERKLDRMLVGEIAAQAEEILALVDVLDRGIDIQSDYCCAALEQGFGASLADARSCTGDQGNLAGVGRRRAAFSQLGLLQIPVFDLEQRARGKSTVAAKCLRALHHLHAVPIQLCDYRCVFRAPAGRGQAEIRIERHARRRIEHGLGFAGLRRVLVEISPVAARIGVHVRAEHGQALGADDVVWRDRPLLRQRAQVRALGERQRLLVRMGRHDHGRACREGQLAPQLRLPQHLDPGRPDARQRNIPGPLPFEVILGAAHQFDHALVGLPGAVAE